MILAPKIKKANDFGVFSRYLEEICEIPINLMHFQEKSARKLQISVILLEIHEHVTKICDENLLNF